MKTGARPSARIALAFIVLAIAAPGLSAQEASSADPSMRPGNIDVALSGGLGALIYPFLEPQVDIGLIPLGPVTLSVGATGDVGYCLLCNVLRVIDTNWRLNSYYLGVYGRVLAHVSGLTETLGGDLRVDPYAGLAIGPRFYVVAVEYIPDNASTRGSINSFIIAPQVGARLFLNDDIRWFGFAEASYLIEIGFQSTTLEIGGQTYFVDEQYASGGASVTLGVGLRL